MRYFLTAVNLAVYSTKRHHTIFASLLPLFMAAALALFLSGALGGCARRIGCSNLANVYYLGTVADLNRFAYRATDKLIEGAKMRLYPHNPRLPILVTTFVALGDLTKTNDFGRIMQRAMASRFVQRDFMVRETLLGDTIFIEPRQGETVLTRDLQLLANNHKAQAVVVGTWTRSGRTLYISVRAVNPKDGRILSSQDYHLCMDDDILELFRLQTIDDSIGEPRAPFLKSVLPLLNL